MSDETYNESEAQDTWDPPLPVPVPSEARRVCAVHVFCSSPGLSLYLYHSLRLDMAVVYENNSYMLKHGLPRFVLMQVAFIVLTSQRHFLLRHDCHCSWFEVLGSPASEARLARGSHNCRTQLTQRIVASRIKRKREGQGKGDSVLGFHKLGCCLGYYRFECRIAFGAVMARYSR